ncbi:hypothetical protein [Streptomyces sp. NPDC053755]|uniref:hypothetical protein n=1 Tax=Streptomyces sp. NPDC053755 TaxID=3155815 RepID=UPI0034122DE2
MARHEGQPSDEELDALIAEFSERRTYRPTDDVPEPDEVPQAPSGTAMGDPGDPVASAG